MKDGSNFWSWVKLLFRRKRADRHSARHTINVQRVWGDSHEEIWRSVDPQNAHGVTRDMSATGVYFETDLSLHTGSMIRFTIEFDGAPGGEKTELECRGYVVRTEPRGTGKVGIAVRLDEQHLRPAKGH